MEKFNARILSRLGQSGSVFGLSLMEQKKSFPIKVLAADMSVVAGLDRYKKTFPEDFYNVGIAEQNLIGLSAGLASEGFKTIAVAQGCFISMRSFEQIRQYLGYMRHNVICVGINSGFSLTFFGNTHYALEDLNLMRAIPGMTILSPADAGEAVKAFEAALTLDSPVYIRICGSLNCPIVYKEDFNYRIGKANVLKEGEDITIFATGLMVNNTLKAAEIIEAEGYSVKVIDMHTIKPIDRDIINLSLANKLLVSVEEHNTLGGLGTGIAEVLSETKDSPVLLRLGVQDHFMTVGDYHYLLEQTRLLPEQIAEDILLKFNKL